MNRTDRLVAIVMHLQGRRVVRAEELSAHFSVSLRTIYRDIAALGGAGVPVIGEAGVGYSLVKGYHLPPVMLTAEEASALFTGGEFAKKFSDGSLDAAVDGALAKLRAILPADQKDQIEHLARGTLISRDLHADSAQDAPDRPAFLATVQQAVARRQVLALAYHGRERDARTEREVEPLGVVFYGGNWYLVAWCRLRCGLRHFRVDRIREAATRAERFSVRDGFSLAGHLAECSRDEETYPARIWLARPAQVRARRESHATLAPGEERDGGAEFTLLTWSYDWLARWLLSFGEEAEAIEPDDLREKLRGLAEKIARRHEPAATTLLT